jgi:hypothetical protein
MEAKKRDFWFLVVNLDRALFDAPIEEIMPTQLSRRRYNRRILLFLTELIKLKNPRF